MTRDKLITYWDDCGNRGGKYSVVIVSPRAEVPLWSFHSQGFQFIWLQLVSTSESITRSMFSHFFYFDILQLVLCETIVLVSFTPQLIWM